MRTVFPAPGGWMAPGGWGVPDGWMAPAGWMAPVGWTAPAGWMTPGSWTAPAGWMAPGGWTTSAGWMVPDGWTAPEGWIEFYKIRSFEELRRIFIDIRNFSNHIVGCYVQRRFDEDRGSVFYFKITCVKLPVKFLLGFWRNFFHASSKM